MIDIRDHAGGCTIAIRTQPNAKRSDIIGEHNGLFKIAVTAPPEDGRANGMLLDFFAQWLGAKRSCLQLIGGESNRNKVVLIRGMNAEQLAVTIAQLSGN